MPTHPGKKNLVTSAISLGNFTVILRREKGLALVRDPSSDGDEVGDERRNRTLQDGRVAANHIFLVHIRVIWLVDHYKGGGGRGYIMVINAVIIRLWC